MVLILCRFLMIHLAHRCSSYLGMHYKRKTWSPQELSWKCVQCYARILPITRIIHTTIRSWDALEGNVVHGVFLCLETYKVLWDEMISLAYWQVDGEFRHQHLQILFREQTTQLLSKFSSLHPLEFLFFVIYIQLYMSLKNI